MNWEIEMDIQTILMLERKVMTNLDNILHVHEFLKSFPCTFTDIALSDF